MRKMLLVTIGIKMNIPKCALLAKLKLEPINAFLDRQSDFQKFQTNIE